MTTHEYFNCYCIQSPRRSAIVPLCVRNKVLFISGLPPYFARQHFSASRQKKNICGLYRKPIKKELILARAKIKLWRYNFFRYCKLKRLSSKPLLLRVWIVGLGVKGRGRHCREAMLSCTVVSPTGGSPCRFVMRSCPVLYDISVIWEWDIREEEGRLNGWFDTHLFSRDLFAKVIPYFFPHSTSAKQALRGMDWVISPSILATISSALAISICACIHSMSFTLKFCVFPLK